LREHLLSDYLEDTTDELPMSARELLVNKFE